MGLMTTRAILVGVATATLITAAAVAAVPAAADDDGQLLHDPAGTAENNIYARTVELAHADDLNGRLLATFERDNPSGGPIELLIKSSDDDGRSWSTLSTVTDEREGSGRPASRMWQPELFEFPTKLGTHPAGTIMLVANLVPADGSVTEFFSWYSHDHGGSWEPGEVVQHGGTFGRGIWEPHLMVDRTGRLQMYFADERSAPEHSQMIVHVSSDDGGASWGPVTRDVASSVAGERPGMPTVARIGDNGDYVLAYEICGRAHCNVHVKKSRDGARWGPVDDLGSQVITADGRYPGHSPFITWIPTGGGDGQLVLAGQRVFSAVGNDTAPEDYRAVFVSDGRHLDRPWDWAPAPWTASNASAGCNANYSPHLMPTGDPGLVRLTAPTSVSSSGPCGEATGVASVGTLPFTSAFDIRGQAGWISFGGRWTVDGDSLLQQDPTGFPKALTGSTGWTDYTISSEIKLGADTIDAGLLARVSDPDEGADSHNGYYVGLDPEHDRLVIARQGYAYLELASTPVAGGIGRDDWHRLRLQVTNTRAGTRLRAELAPANTTDAALTLTALDTYTSYPAGMVGLRTHEGEAAFRSVVVEQTR